MKRRAQARIYSIIRNMSPEEELAYWNRPPVTPFEKWWHELMERAAASRKAPKPPARRRD